MESWYTTSISSRPQRQHFHALCYRRISQIESGYLLLRILHKKRLEIIQGRNIKASDRSKAFGKIQTVKEKLLEVMKLIGMQPFSYTINGKNNTIFGKKNKKDESNIRPVQFQTAYWHGKHYKTKGNT